MANGRPEQDWRPRWQRGWRWWLVVVGVVAGSVLAAGLILFGAVRFLDQADRQAERVECIRVQVQVQAKGAAEMAAVVLDGTRTQAERAAAVDAWGDGQRAVAERIGRC